MTITADQIMTLDGQVLPFARDLREALAIYARKRWPSNTSGNMAKAWKIPKSTASNILKGHASDTTITGCLRAGGWEVAIPVIGATLGSSIFDHFNKECRVHEDHADRLRALSRPPAPLGAVRDDELCSLDAARARRMGFADCRMGEGKN